MLMCDEKDKIFTGNGMMRSAVRCNLSGKGMVDEVSRDGCDAGKERLLRLGLGMGG